MAETKVCNRCRERLPVDYFSLIKGRRARRRYYVCYQCAREIARERTARELYEAAKEAIVEVKYWHADMVLPEERAHPRGSGWVRVHDSLTAALAAAREAWGWTD